MITKAILLAWTAWILWAFLNGVNEASLEYGGRVGEIDGIALLVSAIVHFLIWLIVAVPTYMIGRLFQKPHET